MKSQDRFRVIPAVYLIFRDGDKILLLQRANTGYHDGEYSLPAGHIDGGEPAIVAACREAKEEVGVTINPKDLQLAHTLHRFSDESEPHERIDLFFEARRWEGELRNAEPHKCNELRWVNVSELPANTIKEVAQAITMIARNQPYSDYNFQRNG